MKIKNLLIFVLAFSFTLSATFAYTEVNCSTNPVFSENNCGQCFDWWTKAQWDNIWLMTDDWVNSSWNDKILYKEEQEMPVMVNLNPSNVTWTQQPSEENFWEYTTEFNNLYSEEDLWYILPDGEKISWLKSKLWYAYRLDKNTVPAWWNIGLLIYTIVTHDMLDWWATITVDSTEHKECVLFKSWESTEEVTPPKKEEPKRLPETWPEHILLVILALILWFGLLRFRKTS